MAMSIGAERAAAVVDADERIDRVLLDLGESRA